MSRWSKRGGPECRCDYNYTCRACLNDPPPYFNTPAKEGERREIPS